MSLDHTHDASATSWVDTAAGHADFPIQNLPYCRFRLEGRERVGAGIGDFVLDLSALAADEGLPADVHAALQPTAAGRLTDLMAAGDAASLAVRHALFGLLDARNDDPRSRGLVRRHLHRTDAVELLLPCRPPNFSDFYSSIHHAINIGSLVRPDNPLLPNYKWLPVGYHGRTSSIVASGTAFHRPVGQIPSADKVPAMQPEPKLDYEAELGFLIGRPNPLGEPIPLERAREHLFGVALLNDWSARGIQFWEYQPLGPFLGKSFASTLGAWVVSRHALEPFWCATPWRDDVEHRLLPHLDGDGERNRGGLDITVEVYISSERMRREGLPRQRLSVSNYRSSFWTVGQLIVHQTSNGANLEAGDLVGSGTLSGPSDESRACLMEMTRGGKESFTLSSGEQRRFIEDGDEVTLVGACQAPGFARLGLGEAIGRVLPAHNAR
jgi:fumarylacetoacetase